jgi:hypothetical protein
MMASWSVLLALADGRNWVHEVPGVAPPVPSVGARCWVTPLAEPMTQLSDRQRHQPACACQGFTAQDRHDRASRLPDLFTFSPAPPMICGSSEMSGM